MKIYTTQWAENGRVGQRSFHTKALALEFGREKVRSADATPVSVWLYEAAGPSLHLLISAHDKAVWWDHKTYVGTVLKSGNWTTR